ncbi:uncharacterized protein NPIL_693431 [Nephila pilipes]|uniref:Transcription factor Adf-1 n=1 Tax=Nephila pilipes TaxID=299642 RepID=A0A8X6T9D0_NEPPI|nr:uncharacterized protein NPIL_693431 [Nephila pilipes]
MEEDEILINSVESHEALYNVKHRDYRKSELKQRLWNNIGATIEKSGNNCLKRWNYVRDYYIRRRGKPGSGTTGEAAKKRSDLLSFLDHIPSSQTTTIPNIIADEISEHKIAIIEEEDDIEENTSQYEEIYGMTELNFDEEDRTNEDCMRNKKRKCIHSEERLQEVKEIVQQKAPQNELDEVDLYFNCMAKIVKKLPLYEQVQLRMQISTLIGNAELRTLSNESRHYSSSRPYSILLNDQGKIDNVSDESSNVSEVLILSENEEV